MQNLNQKLGTRGQGLVEYILIVVVMALMAIGGIRILGKNAHNAFIQASSVLSSDMSDATSKGNTANTMR